MDWITGLQRALDYVEENITEQLDYEEVAKKAYSSSFHFQRVFSAICGFTLGDYIRFRRLSLAGSELASTDRKVIDVALKYGYDTPESFSRAFTRFHGICKYIPKYNIFDKCIIGVSFNADGTSLGSDFPYGIGAHYNGEAITEDYLTVETIPAHTYAVFKCVGPMPEAFQKVYKYICTEFFPASEYKPCGIEIESYPSADTKNADYTCEVWIAVEKK